MASLADLGVNSYLETLFGGFCMCYIKPKPSKHKSKKRPCFARWMWRYEMLNDGESVSQWLGNGHGFYKLRRHKEHCYAGIWHWVFQSIRLLHLFPYIKAFTNIVSCMRSQFLIQFPAGIISSQYGVLHKITTTLRQRCQ